MSRGREGHRALLLRVARATMVERGFEPEFRREAMAQVEQLEAAPGDGLPDLTALPWCSIDNDDSRDLDQLTVAEPLDGGAARIRVAVADVDALVKPGSPVNDHAEANTTSVYTPARIFAMLPERLSTDLTSLAEHADRVAVVIEVVVDAEGHAGETRIAPARVRNQAKLAYSSVGAWLEGRGAEPAPIGDVPGLAENLRLQDAVAQRLKTLRHDRGALELDIPEPRARFDGDAVRALEAERHNRAHQLIEDFMIASNQAMAAFLEARRFPVVRRIVRIPQRWDRIVDLARGAGDALPDTPDARALNAFLVRRAAADPLRFPDLSLAVVKLLGRGEYVIALPGEAASGHFALAVEGYTHSTAPNRRYPDLITQRLVGAALAGGPVPYAPDQLTALATHCTHKEEDAQKVERTMRKVAAACMLEGRIGAEFDGVVTGASEKGTWARVFDPPVEGRIVQGERGLDVGDRVRVRLVGVRVERGFIDFERVTHTRSGAERSAH